MSVNNSLFVKYRPQKFSEVVEQDAIKQILMHEIQTNNIKRCLLFTGGAGTGKAQPLYSQVLTPSGFKQLKDLKLQDVVFTAKGNLARIVGIYPQGKRPIYEITLQDNTKIRVSDNHLNCVWYYDQRKKQRQDLVLTTNELLTEFKNCKYKLRMDVPSVDFLEQPVKINPYLLGALLGDGGLSKSNLTFCNSEQDIVEKVNNILNKDYGMYLKRKNINKFDYNICYIDNPKHNGSKGNKGLHELVRNYNHLDTLKGQIDYYNLNCKSVDKHIPKEYLFNTKEVRLQVLQGLYDTDGHKGGRLFSTSSENLAKDLAFLMRSLGIRVTITKKASFYNGKQCQDHYCLHIKCPKDLQIFTSEKHKKSFLKQQNNPLRNIQDITYIGDELCQCIMLDHEDHTYISDDFIPTHNTTTARIYANEIEPCKSNIIEINCADHTGVDDIRQLVIEPSRQKPLQGKYKVFILDENHMLTVQAQSALLKILEEPPSYCIYIMCTTDPQKVLPTILSRTFRYDFQLISYQGIVDRLNYILTTEKSLPNNCGIQSWDMDSLNYIALQSRGHLRDAITTLQKVVSFDGNITVNSVEKVLGVTSFEILFNVLDCIISKNDQLLIQQLDNLNKSGINLKLFVKNFLQFVLDVNKYLILKTETNNTSLDFTLIPPSYVGRLVNYNVSHRPILKNLLRTLLQLNSSLRWETDVKPVLETNLLMEVL